MTDSTCDYPDCTSTDTATVMDWSHEPPAEVSLCADHAGPQIEAE